LPIEPSDSAGQSGEIRGGKNVVRVAFLGTPLYGEPDEASATLAYLNEGTLMQVVSEQDGFLHVRIADGAEGYVRSNAVAVVSP
jgi:hypothetical protein